MARNQVKISFQKYILLAFIALRYVLSNIIKLMTLLTKAERYDSVASVKFCDVVHTKDYYLLINFFALSFNLPFA